jgi:D-amino-acid dehydrogenase
MNVLVLGGGVVGLAAAYYLARDGHEVAVVERNHGVGLETSYANGGQLSYSYVAPLAGPGVLPKIPPWLLRRDAPLRFRPALDWQQWRWCLEFVLACTRRQADLTTRRLLRLAYYSRSLMHRFLEREHAEFDYVQNGKLVVHSDPRAFDAARRLLDYQASLGSEQQALSADECVVLEPALRTLRPRLAGGIYTPSEDAGDCYEFCLALERILRAHGARFLLDTEIRRLLRWRDRIMGVETSAGVLEADRYVLALGAASPWLVRPLGIRLPIYPLKGYSLTLPVGPGQLAPRMSITDFKKKIVYARLGDELRVAGMADLAGHRPDIDESRIATLLDETRAAFPEASDFSRLRPWCGLRPATPKGTPILGRTPYPKLLLDCGQGALGFTLALGCGRVIADLAAGRTPDVPLEGFELRLGANLV